jgi:DNA invertase Pin-like site-specific DNA recombinase
MLISRVSYGGKMERKRLRYRVELPKSLREIREEIVCQTVRLFGTQKAAAKNLGISEATVSHMLNRKGGPRG